MLGLELLDGAVRAVRLDAGGTVLARAHVDATDPAAAARDVLDRLARRDATSPVGIATAFPNAPAAGLALASIAARDGQAGGPPDTHLVAAGTAAAVAEVWLGAARGGGDVVYFAAAEHVTAGLVRGGEAVAGGRLRGPAAAWLALNPVEREDYRRVGCLEAEVAASGIVRRIVWRIKAGDKSRVEEMVNDDLSAITADRILEAARQGDGVAISVLRDTAKYLGMAAANLVAIAAPDVLVLGGVMASASDLLLEPVRVELTRRLPAAMAESLSLVTASLGADAPAIGAARMAAAPR
jgi:predicted NBD/HSP70 family sugar kinase